MTKAATCTEKGVETRSCGCGETETREIAATGIHTFGDWETVKTATCTAEGQMARACTHCGLTETQAIPTLEHTTSHVEAVKATCTARGALEHWYCGGCQGRWLDAALTNPAESIVLPLDPDAHSYGSWTEHSGTGCTNPGYMDRVCQLCGHVEVENYPATHHVDANRDGICDKCENPLADDCDHGNVVPVEAKAPDCDETGVIAHWFCQDCLSAWLDEGRTQKAESVTVPALGHSAAQVEAKAATCTADGNLEYWYCAVCGSYWKDGGLTQVTNAEGVVIAALGHKDENSDNLCDNCEVDLSLGTEGNPAPMVPGEEISCEFAEGGSAVYYQWTAAQDGIFTLNLTGDDVRAALSSNGLNPNAADPADKQAQILGGESVTWEVGAGETVTLALSGSGNAALMPGFTAQTHEIGSMCNPMVVQDAWSDTPNVAEVEISVAPGEILYLDVSHVRGTWLDAFAFPGIRITLNGAEQTVEDGIVSVAIGKDAAYLTIENGSQRNYNTELSFEYMEGHENNPRQLKLGSQEVRLSGQDFFGRYFTWTAPADGKFTFHIESLNGHDLWQYQIRTAGAGDPAHDAEEEPLVDTVTWDVEEGMVLTVHIIGYGYTPDKVLGLPGAFWMETSFAEAEPQPPVDPNVVASGSCGEGASWVLDVSGVLTVSGKGNAEGAPWKDHADKILSLVVESGIEGLGSDSFRDCTSLGSVTLPDTLKTIGSGCFSGCTALEELKIPAGVQSIGENAFAGCDNLTLTVTPGSPAETYAQEQGIPCDYPPAAESVTITLNGEDVTGQTLTVDMKFDPTLKLGAALLPEGAEEEITWKVSDSKLASVADGTVTFKKPGTVTVTATVSGTKLSASVKLDVLYLTTAKKLTAEARYPAEGLQQGYTAQMQVWAEEELKAQLLEFTSSDEKMATVDENGVITAGSKAGTVTAAIKGDPLKRKVSLKVKIIAKQTHQLRLVPMADDTAQIVMLDGSGNVTEYYDRAAHFVLYIDKADVSGGSWSFRVLPNATGEKGEDVPLNEKSLKWSTSDSRVASVKVEKATGFGLITVKAKTSGACTVKAVSNDLRKVEAYITVHVREYTPRLEKTSLTMNDHQVAPITVGLVESYGNAVQEVSLHEYSSKSKSYLEEASQRFAVSYADGKLSISRMDSVKNGTYKLLLKALCENGETYEYKLSLKVSRSLPSATVKQMDKINLFYKDSETVFQVSAKSGDLVDVRWVGNDAFVSRYDADKGILTLCYSESAKAAEEKVSTKGTIAFYFRDYHVPVEKAVTLKTEKKAPKLTMDPAVSVVNTALNGEPVARVQVWPHIDETMSVTADAPFAEVSGSGNQVKLTLKENKGGTAYLYVKCAGWMESVKLTHKVKVETKLPAVNPLPKITLNRFFTEQGQTVPVALSQSNLTVGSMTLEPTAKSESLLAEAGKIRFGCNGNSLSIRLEENDLPKAGSYEFRLNVTLEDGTELAPRTFKVTVESKVPTVKLKSAALKLNKNLGTAAYAETAVILPKGYENFTVADMIPEETSDAFRVSYNAETGMLRAELLDASAKSETVKLYPVVEDLTTGQQVQLEKAVSLKLSVYAAKPAVVLTAKGQLDTIVPGSAIVYTVKKLSNISGVPEAVRLEGEDAELFRTELTKDGSQVILTLADGSAVQKGKTYKLQLVFTIDRQEVIAKVSVKVNQSTVKLQSVKMLNLYQSNARLGCVLEVKAPEGAEIGNITLNPKTAKQFALALGGEDGLTFTRLPDGRVVVSFKVTNPGYLTWGKSYSVYLDVTPEGNAQNAKPVTVKLTVKTFQ